MRSRICIMVFKHREKDEKKGEHSNFYFEGLFNNTLVRVFYSFWFFEKKQSKRKLWKTFSIILATNNHKLILAWFLFLSQLDWSYSNIHFWKDLQLFYLQCVRTFGDCSDYFVGWFCYTTWYTSSSRDTSCHGSTDNCNHPDHTEQLYCQGTPRQFLYEVLLTFSVSTS